MFRMILVPQNPIRPGNYFCCSNGHEAWQWHKIIRVNSNEGKMQITWAWGEHNEKIADPLSISIFEFNEDLKHGLYRIGTQKDADKIPMSLKLVICSS